MNETTSFSAEQTATANTVLRAAVGLAPQAFSTEQFVGMISEEIEQLRAAGKTDDDIVDLLSKQAGVKLSADSIRRYCSETTRGGDSRSRA